MTESSCVITVDELAAMLRLNRDTAYRAIQQRKIPGVRRIGRVIRIHRAVVMAWLEHQPLPPQERLVWQ